LVVAYELVLIKQLLFVCYATKASTIMAFELIILISSHIFITII